jgi:hypothetical protein
VEFKLYDDKHDDDGSVYEILSFLVVNPEMDPSTIPLPRLEALKIICHPTKENRRTFMKVIESRWWSDRDEEENAIQKQGQRSLSRISLKRSIIMNVHNDELNMFNRDDADVLRAQDMTIFSFLLPLMAWICTHLSYYFRSQ